MINLNAVDVDGLGVGRLNGERLEDNGHVFRVGDFVWRRGRRPTDPWWPGQVFDPRDASEFALKYSEEGRLLVVLFGDGSCCWALPSELVPFFDNLHMMRSDTSKGFVKALQNVFDEIGRIVESKITCRCIPLERRGHLARPVAVNVGVKPGVLVPEVDIGCLSIPEYEASEILVKVLNFAKSVSFDNMFELAILRSWISVYSYARHGCRLCVYSDPVRIEGLEDRDGDKKIAVNVPIHGPELDDPLSPKASSAMSRGKIYQRKKKKSIGDPMVKRKTFKSRARKRSDNELERCSSSRKQAVEGESDDGVEDKVKVNTESSSKKRKKSKYPSPPFTKHTGRIEDKFPMDDKATSDEWLGTTDSKNSPAVQYEKRMTFDASDVDMDVEELLLMLESSALDPLYLRKEGLLDPIWAFVSAYRSSAYLHGSNYKVFHKCNKVINKRKSIATPKISSPSKRSTGKRGSSQPTDDLVSDARAMTQKLDTMIRMLEKHGSSLSVDVKSCLKGDMKRLMDDIETTSEKVRSMAS